MMHAKLSIMTDVAVLTVTGKSGRVEVRGNPAVGTVHHHDDPLDQVMDRLSPPGASVLHSGDELHPYRRSPRGAGDVDVLFSVLDEGLRRPGRK